MLRTRKLSALLAIAACAGLAVAGCSSHGGKAAQQQSEQVSGGQASTPRMTVAMITHAVPGDTFWDHIRDGARAAAKVDNVNLVYTNSPTGSKQATLIENAIDQHVDGIAVTMAHPAAVRGAIQDAIKAGIPVVGFNAGFDDWKKIGVMSYFGQNETLAGEAFGRKLNEVGAKHVICVNQEQGSVQLEARCSGMKDTFKGQSEVLYVNSADLPSVRSKITAKLQADSSIDYVATLGAPFAAVALKAIQDANSKAKVATFDINDEVAKSIRAGDVKWSVFQQPRLQGYLAVNSLWLYKYQGMIIGGGQPVLTGPTYVTKDNIDHFKRFAK